MEEKPEGPDPSDSSLGVIVGHPTEISNLLLFEEGRRREGFLQVDLGWFNLWGGLRGGRLDFVQLVKSGGIQFV